MKTVFNKFNRKFQALNRLFNRELRSWSKENIIRWKLRFSTAILLFISSAICFMPFKLFTIEQYNFMLINAFEPIAAITLVLLAIYCVSGFLSLYYAQKVWKSL